MTTRWTLSGTPPMFRRQSSPEIGAAVPGLRFSQVKALFWLSASARAVLRPDSAIADAR